jgi:hypothetical protein
VNSLLTGTATRSLNPQNDAGRVKGGADPGGLPFGSPAGQGRGGRHHPPSTLSSAPSATIALSRLTGDHLHCAATARGHALTQVMKTSELNRPSVPLMVGCALCPAGSLVEVNAPGLCPRHDTLDNDPDEGALPVQLRVGPGSGDDGPVAGGIYGAVRL